MDEIINLIQVTENVLYVDPESEMARNLTNIINLLPKPCCCNGGVSTLSMPVPVNIASDGAALSSYIANQLIYGDKENVFR
jgi:hypothetical protein